MQMHEILTSQSGWRQLAADRAKHARAEAKHRQRLAATTANREEVLARHARAYHAAILEGEEPPPQPQVEAPDPNLADATRLLIDRGQELVAQERRFLATHAAALERQLTARHDELLAEARPAVAKLEAIAEEMRLLTASTSQVRDAAGDRRPVIEGRITPARVAEVVGGGGSFLRPRPGAPTVSYSAPYLASDGEDAALFTPDDGDRVPVRGSDARLDRRR